MKITKFLSCYRKPASSLLLARLVLAFLPQSADAGTRTVTSLADSGAGSLRAAIAASANGDRIDFAVSGIIRLTSGELVSGKTLGLDGPGENILTISGNNASRVFQILPGADVALSKLTLREGRLQASPGDPYAEGGGILNRGTLRLTNCTLVGHVAIGADGPDGFAVLPPGQGGFARGGGICNHGTLLAISCTIQQNAALGGWGGRGIVGGIGADGGVAEGGGIWSDASATLLGCLISNNEAQAGRGGNGGDVNADDNRFARGGNGGPAFGGAIFNTNRLILRDCTLSDNRCFGGLGGLGGNTDLGAGGGSGGRGGGALGGGLFDLVSIAATNCTFFGNFVRGGTGGFGGNGRTLAGRGGDGGDAFGGALVDPSAWIISCTIAENEARPGRGGPGGSSLNGPGAAGYEAESLGGGLVDNSGFRNTGLIRNTILARNRAHLGADAYGEFISGGYNLVGDGSWAGAFFQTGDRVGTLVVPIDPKFGSFHNLGGANWVMTLAPDSPARDQGHRSGLDTDQRGGRRPLDSSSVPNAPGGDGSDIGAVEMGSLFRLTDIRAAGSQFNVSFMTEPGWLHRLESKDALAPGPWTVVPGSTVMGTGRVLTVPDTRARVAHRFYRAVMSP